MSLIKQIYNKYKDSTITPKLEYPYDCHIINMICDKEGYKLVRGAYNPKNKTSIDLFKKGATRIIKTHIQLCIRDESVISDYCICMR